MGVAGLWEVLRPAGQVRSLTELAVQDGFNSNPSQRGFRIGIDASIWFFHAAYGREGENPELRTLFFRCCRLLQSPLLPLFVFDGPNRPAVKRGKRVGGNAHWLMEGMKNIIDAFGFEWWVAPGEAEAELAYLNRIGIIDAVLSDDVDNFLFGATMVIRNNSLSGNRAHPVKNAQGKDDGNHVITYTANGILSDPSVALSRSGAILIGLLSGGDYIPAGLPGCGQKFATGLARAGFGDSLLKAVEELRGARLDAFLDQWRQDVKKELKTNQSGLLPSKKPSLAASLPDDFPSLPVLMSYADPLTTEKSPQKGKRKALGVWRGDPDPMRIASLCELYFEWGVKDVIVQRFRTVLWPGIVCRAVRRAVMDAETRQHDTVDDVRRPDSEEEDATGPSSPTKRIASTLAALALSSPPKRSLATSSSICDLSTSKPFTLSSLVTLTSIAPPSSSCSTPPSPGPSPLLLEILSQRTHASTDSILEHRVLIDPTALVERAESGVKGLRPPLIGGLFGIDEEDDGTIDQDADESRSEDDIERLETAAGAASKSGKKKRKAHRDVPTTPLRLWLPACMVQAAAPVLVQAYEEKVRAREEKKAKKGTRGVRGGRVGTMVKMTSGRAKGKDIAEYDNDRVPRASVTKTAAMPKAKPRGVRVGGRRKPKQVSEAQDDAYECIDLSAGESPCSSDGGDVKEDAKVKAKAKTTRTDVTRRTAKANANTDATHSKATTPSTVKDFYCTTKPSTVRATKSKSTTARLTAKPSTRDPATPRNAYEQVSTDVDFLPPLPKSSRPLDVLREKSRSTVPVNPTSATQSDPTVTPAYEESSSSSPPQLSGPKLSASGLPCRSIQPAPQTRKKPSFVDVSDTDSDIEVSDIQCPSSGATGTTIAAPEVIKGGATTGAGVSSTPSTSRPNATRPMSTPLILEPTASLPSVKWASSTSVQRADGDVISSMPISQSPSKLNHILLLQSPPESEGERGDEEDELPMFHRGSAKSKAKKAIKAMVRPAPRPFPMQLTSEALAYASRYDDKEDDDVVEFVDVFTTPRGPLPPRSPTPSPSPVQTLSVDASAGPDAFMKPKQSSKFATSPINSQFQTVQRNNVKPCRSVSSDWDTHRSGDEKNWVHKSPRRSAAHSSPRHQHGSHAHGHALSPIPLSHCTSPVGDGTMLWPSEAEYRASDSPRSPLEDSESRYAVNSVRPKPPLGDTSVIYISSSEDEDDALLGVDISRDGGETAIYKDSDEWTDQDTNEWADTGMILSAPPSPSHAPSSPARDAVTSVEAFPEPVRMSKFKPAAAAALKTNARALSTEPQAFGRTIPMKPKSRMHDEDAVVLCALHRIPLLAARAKQSEAREDDIIDLTSD